MIFDASVANCRGRNSTNCHVAIVDASRQSRHHVPAYRIAALGDQRTIPR